MTDPQPWWETVEWLDVFITSGLLTTLLTIFLKWRHDKKKMPLERKQIESGIANDNITSTVAINAEYRQLLEVHKASFKADLDRQKERHAEEIQSLRNHQESSLDLLRNRLDSLETANVELQAKVTRLERDDRTSREELLKQHTRIGKLETNLTSAKDTVITLITYIKDHPNVATGEIPIVDFTIFDV